MKKQMIDENELMSPKDDIALKNVFENILLGFEEKLDINFYGAEHEYRLFRLYCIINTKRIHESIEEFINTMEYIIDAYNKNNECFLHIMKKTIEKRDEALEFFWQYREDGKRYMELSKEKYNFREKSMTLLNILSQLIENIIKREAFLLNKVNVIMEKSKLDSEDELYDVIQNLFKTPTYKLNEKVRKNLNGIPINQYRNIVAHSSFELKNNKIHARYGKNKFKILSIDEVEDILNELYALRLFIKICTNLTIDFMIIKYPNLRSHLKIIPETAILDINSIIEQYGFKIIKYEITDNLCINGEEIQYEGDEVFFINHIICEENRIKDVCLIICIIIFEMVPIFKKKNNYPDLEKIMWVLKLSFNNTENTVRLFMEYDEVKNLRINPIMYSNIIENKIRANDGIKDYFKL